MKRISRVRRVMISISFVAALLVACGGAATPTSAPTALPPTLAPTSPPPTQAPATAAPSPTIAPTTAPTDTPAAATDTPAASTAESRTLTVMTHDSFAASDDVLKAFEQANNVKLNFLKSGDAGAALNKAILAKGNPLADVFYGVDNTFLSRALENDIYDPYAPAGFTPPAQFQLDTANPPRVQPVDYGDVCINYDKAYFAQKKLAVPQNLEDLVKPAYKGLLVTENPATSSTGLVFMLATVAHFGPDKFLDYWKQLQANGVKVEDGWDAAYNTDFSGSAGKGPRPLVVSYASSPPAEVVFAKSPLTDSPIGTVLGDGACFRQIEYVGVLKGAKNPDLARKFVDYMLSVKFQEDMPLQMFVFPVNPQAKLPDEFIKYAQIPKNPATLSPDDIAKNRDAWIQSWTEAVLQK
jgi:thiamine transport system substrate-binding protein